MGRSRRRLARLGDLATELRQARGRLMHRRQIQERAPLAFPKPAPWEAVARRLATVLTVSACMHGSCTWSALSGPCSLRVWNGQHRWSWLHGFETSSPKLYSPFRNLSMSCVCRWKACFRAPRHILFLGKVSTLPLLKHPATRTFMLRRHPVLHVAERFLEASSDQGHAGHRTRRAHRLRWFHQLCKAGNARRAWRTTRAAGEQ